MVRGPVALTLPFVLAVSAGAADLQPRTLAAFTRYVDLTEGRIAREVSDSSRFLWIDTLSDDDRRSVLATLGEGKVAIERRRTPEDGAPVSIDDGMIHHWVGTVFVPGVPVDAAVALMQDYDRHATLFAPAIAGSRTMSRVGNRFRVFLRFYMKKVLAATVNTENDAEFFRPSVDRAYSAIRSTRVAEVDNPGTPEEREREPGHDSGFVWRLNTYWRFAERDGGTYVQCESVSLSRDVPLGLGWIIKPFITDVPKDALTFTLERTRAVLTSQEQH